MKKLLLALLLLTSPAWAAPQGTVNLASPTGTMGEGGDGTYLFPMNTLCGAASATLYATCLYQVQVNSSGQLSVTVGNSTLAVTQSTSPWVDSVTTWGGSTLGAASNYGTSPGAVLVPGVNAFITNVPAVSQSGTWTVQPGNTANTTAWLVTGTGGTFPVTQATAASLNATVVGTGTFATQSTVTQATASNLNAQVVGAAASGASVSGNPLLDGGRAENAEPTAVTNGQAIAEATDLVGRAIVFPYANKENLVEGSATITLSGTPVSLIASGGSGLYIYITHVDCVNSGSTATTVSLENGSGGTAFWTTYLLNGGGGMTADFPSPIGGPALSLATAVYAAIGSSSSSVYCNANGFKGT